MRVEQFQPPSVKPAEGAPSPDRSADTEGPTAGGQTDQVSLSRLAQALWGEVGHDTRLERLGSAVAAGSYQAPAAELSRRLVDFHLRAED
jgi:hypothetical protein